MVAAVLGILGAAVVALLLAAVATQASLEALHERVRRLEEARERELVTWPDTGRAEDR